MQSFPIMDALEIGEPEVVDVYSGIGGLTHGFFLEGFKVVAGIDIDDTCRYGFERNNDSKFICRDVAKISPQEVQPLYSKGCVRILVGCAPCQPYSQLNLRRTTYANHNEKWISIEYFMGLIIGLRPQIVSMENVAGLADERKFPVFGKFVRVLKEIGYYVSHGVVDAAKYGVPQRRRRLVLLASRLGPISLVPETHADRKVTVREAIRDLPPIRAGQVSKSDALHRASTLSPLNLRRIKATPKNGGDATKWDRELLPPCFKKKRGQSYKVSVYGRMRWNRPGPTITTHCTILGTGRFGHPSQNRAISLREAARLQSFPDYYEIQDPAKLQITQAARHIGNAVPVKLGRAIAFSIKAHLREFGRIEANR